MQYHAVALAVNGVDVDLIGEEGVPLPSSLQHPRIRVHRLKARRGWTGIPGSAGALFVAACRARRPDVILVQTPPAVPTLAIAWAVARLRRSRLVFDWHNLGWTIVAGRHGAAHPAVRLARVLERLPSRLADAHLAVTDALASHLRATWGLARVQVLRDRPAEAFAGRTPDPAIRARLIAQAGLATGADPAVVISPTSWTGDEALDLVFPAADALEDLWRGEGPADGLILVISGTGAGREPFERRLRARVPRRVRILTTWVPGDEYPALLASADAGLSLHRSASGLDLPMKIADLFGSSLPVCAYDYGPALRELVSPDRNAVLFRDARGLAGCLDRLFRTWPAPSAMRQRLQEGAAAVACGPRWGEGWQREARAVILPFA